MKERERKEQMMTLVDAMKVMDELGIYDVRVHVKGDGKWRAECEVNHFSITFYANGRDFNEAFRNLITKVGVTVKPDDYRKGATSNEL